MQNFKGDALELQMIGAMSPISDQLSGQKDLFFDGCYETQPLGELIFDGERAPLANAIDRQVFIESFKDMIDAFVAGGTFEAYLTVFRKIFGDDVVVDFTVPAAGRLQIDITATGFELSHFIARELSGSVYTNYAVLERSTLDNICFRTVKGFVSEYELTQMLYEMVPAGIFTEISLTI